MALSKTYYLQAIRDALNAVLNLRYFPSPLVERQVHPEIEFQDNPKLLYHPLVISKSEQEHTMIEASINSVRVSVAIRKSDEVFDLLTKMLERFMALRADRFKILRKKPAHEGYDFSFLIWNEHLLEFKKEELINFILEFVQGIEQEITELKMMVRNHCTMTTNFFSHGCCNKPLPAMN